MKHEDLRDLFAHLKTLPAVQGKVRDHDVPFPFNVRRTLGRLEAAVPRRRAVQAGCVEGSRRGIAAPISSTAPATAPNATRRATCSAASSAASASPAGLRRKAARAGCPTSPSTGCRHWSDEDIVKLLETGENRDADTVGGEMGKVVSNTKQLSDAGPRGDGGLYQVAAAGRRTAPTCCEDSCRSPESPRGWLDEFVQGHLAQARFGAAVCIAVGVHPLPGRDRRAGRPDGVLPQRLRHHPGGADLCVAARADVGGRTIAAARPSRTRR